MTNKFFCTLFQKYNFNNFIDNLYFQVKFVYFFYFKYKKKYDSTCIKNDYVEFLNDLNKINDTTKINDKNKMDDAPKINDKNKMNDISKVNDIIKEELEELYELFINDTILINNLDKGEKYLIDIIYEIYCTDKKLKNYIKDFDLFYVDKKIIDYINTLIINHTYNNVCNLFSNLGNIIFKIYNELTIFELYNNNHIINMICYLNFLLYNKIYNIHISTCNILTTNIINNKYDLVLCDIPINIKNLIYTNCNSKIKSLKIRGTKSEPLIFQFISQILNKNGKAIIITPNSFLFGDSLQHILTRKYLLENFNIKIIDLNNKKSLVVLDKYNIINNNYNITFNTLENNKECNINEIIYDNNKLINNNYSFYYYNYLKINKTNIDSTIKIKDIINIYDNKFKNYNENCEYFYSFKYNQFNIDKITNIENYDYIFITKDDTLYNQNFINIYLKELFTKYNKQITKGVINQLNIDIINNIDIIIPSIEIQNTFYDYYNNIKIIKIINNNQIKILENIKNNIINKYINESTKIELSNICTITHEGKQNTIYIYKNSSLAGYINLLNSNYEKNINNYYIHINDKTQYNQDYIYYILLYYQNYFIVNANNNKTICLSKKIIDSFLIPDINLDLQLKLNKEITKINSFINYYYQSENINNTDIIQLYYNNLFNL